ncbi:MAG TPA: caspase family protein, partial [Flavobacteriaceae bacterium]|nr:caspase family protein [Flavobacteriaceae bacterium]
DACNNESFTFDIDAKQQVSEVHLDCMNVLDAAFSNNTLALIVENFGLVLTDRVLKFTKGEFPKNVSFNDDASKFMLTLSNGKIVVYDTATLKPIGGMVHPSKDRHVFYTHDNYYFGNIDASQFLYATKQDVSIPLTETESVSFRPDKVLEMFGEVDQKYLEVLNKALELRQQYTASTISNTTTVSKENRSQVNLGKPDLYFLSVGVSDYQDNNFNLTYADKDAIDMANYYGKLDKETLDEYKTRFFGNKYVVYLNDSLLSYMKKYQKDYLNYSNFYSLNSKGNLWLEVDYKETVIWDFASKSIKPVSIPKSFNSSIGKNDIILDPDEQGFYLKNYDNSYYYEFSSEKVKTVDFPIEARLISDKKWMQFEIEDNKGVISIGKVGSNKVQEQVTFDILNYTDVKTNKHKTLDYAYGPSLFAVASGGNELVYKINEDDVFYVNLALEKITPVKITLPVNLGYGDTGYLHAKSKTLSVQVTDYSNHSEAISTYSFEGELVSSGYIDTSNSLVYRGFGVSGDKLFQLNMEAPMVESNYYQNNDSLIENTQAFSFDKVFIKTLTDSEATKENIKEQLKNFLSKADANDQVMVFLAGHGVLDKDLNYYFAPHDMDFTKVSKNGLSFQELIAGFDGSQSANKLLLMDSCHSGNTLDLIENNTVANTHDPSGNNRGSVGVDSANKSDYKVSSIVKTLFDDFLSKSGVTVISAASGGDLAQEGTSTQKFKGNGAFTYAYLQVLKDNFSGIFMSEEKMKQSLPLTQEFVNELMKQVMLLTDGKQVPDLREINTSAEIKIW